MIDDFKDLDDIKLEDLIRAMPDGLKNFQKMEGKMEFPNRAQMEVGLEGVKKSQLVVVGDGDTLSFFHREAVFTDEAGNETRYLVDTINQMRHFPDLHAAREQDYADYAKMDEEKLKLETTAPFPRLRAIAEKMTNEELYALQQTLAMMAAFGKWMSGFFVDYMVCDRHIMYGDEAVKASTIWARELAKVVEADYPNPVAKARAILDFLQTKQNANAIDDLLS